MVIWKTELEVERGYDDKVDFFTLEDGHRTYSLFGIKLYEKKFNTKTKSFVINEKVSKRKGEVGFK